MLDFIDATPPCHRVIKSVMAAHQLILDLEAAARAGNNGIVAEKELALLHAVDLTIQQSKDLKETRQKPTDDPTKEIQATTNLRSFLQQWLFHSGKKHPLSELSQALRRMSELAKAEKNGTVPPMIDFYKELPSMFRPPTPGSEGPVVPLPPIVRSTPSPEAAKYLAELEERRNQTPEESAKELLQGFAAAPHLMEIYSAKDRMWLDAFVKKALPKCTHVLPAVEHFYREFPVMRRRAIIHHSAPQFNAWGPAEDSLLNRWMEAAESGSAMLRRDVFEFIARNYPPKKDDFEWIVSDISTADAELSAFDQNATAGRDISEQVQRICHRAGRLDIALALDQAAIETLTASEARNRLRELRVKVEKRIAQFNVERSASEEKPKAPITGLIAPIETPNNDAFYVNPDTLESTIVESMRPGEIATGEKIAEKCNAPYNSNFKNVLSSLRKRSILENLSPGYRLTAGFLSHREGHDQGQV